MEPIIWARALGKSYGGQPAVADVDLSVAEGTILGVVGPSGSGKTTTVRMLLGAEAPSSGEVRVLGTAPWAFTPAQRRRLGYMPQLSVLYPELTLQENLNFAASVYGMPLRRRRRLREVLDFVDLFEHRRKRLRDTSGGMQRRLALAAALVHEPDLLFLDEPTAGIGPIQRRSFWQHFTDLRDRAGTLVITTQYVSEAEHCDEVAVIVRGRLVACAPPDELRQRAFGGDVITLTAASAVDPSTVAALGAAPSVREVVPEGDYGRALRVVVDRADTAIPKLQDWFSARRIPLDSIREHHPPFEEVFVQLVEQATHA
jgi:ABC-2 type transport system ATP-binding protein